MFRSKPVSAVVALSLTATLFLAAGCGKDSDGSPDTGDDCTTVVLFAFNPDARKCVQYSCDRSDGWTGEYATLAECEEANQSAGDAGMSGDTGDTGSQNPRDTGGSPSDVGDTGSQQPDTGGSETGDQDTGSGNDPDTGPDTNDAGGDTAPTKTCADYGKNSCFSHSDCQSSHRCENVQSAGDPLPCCSKGPRGDLTAGAECDGPNGQIDCNSGVCVSGSSGPARCSKTCESKKDCPEGMKKCVSVFGGGDSWCFPSN